jgi:hypothetical protein
MRGFASVAFQGYELVLVSNDRGFASWICRRHRRGFASADAISVIVDAVHVPG